MTFAARIIRAIGEDRRLMVASVGFGLVFTMLGLLPPLLIREMIHWLQDPAIAGNFWVLGGLVAVVYVFRGASRYLYGLFSHIAAYRTLHRLTLAVYRHLQRMSPSYLQRRHSGGLVARTVGDVESIEDFIAHGIPESLLAIVIPLAMSVVLFVLNWQLALVALLPLPIVALLVYVLARRTSNLWRGVRRRFAEVSATVQDHLSGVTVIQSFVRESEMADRVAAHSRRYRDSIIHANRRSLLPSGVIEAAAGAGLVLIVWAGGWINTSGDKPGGLQVDVADLVVFLMYLGQIFLPFLRLANLADNLQKAAASAQRVFELLDEPSAIVDAPDARVPDKPRFDVTFDHVSFEYRPGLVVLDDVSFRVNAGETVALVGVTGVGKSTACHLLVRFHDVGSGAIRLGDSDLRELPLAWLRDHVALVEQDVFLFEGTVAENLRLGDPGASDEQLAAAARAAHAHEFIRSFPDAYDTPVGERGVRLSGGQKQRIAIARALLKDAPVLLLDEATSAVDPGTESQIKDALSNLTADRTVLIVAHRASTIMSADRIVVLEGGRVVQSGTYDELAAEDGAFVRLCASREDVMW